MSSRILIVDDEKSIVDNVTYALRQDGFVVSSTPLGSEALERARQEDIDLIVLDIGLPDESGIEICRKLRTFSNVPVIFLTARDAEVDRIVGLELGADDYVTKPFSPRELAARVRAILRRGGERTVSGARLVMIDAETKAVLVDGNRLDLTPYEFGILETLLDRPGNVWSREQLLDRVWHDPLDVNDRAVDTHIKAIRSKLTHAGVGEGAIRTHRGFGYSIDPAYVGSKQGK